MTLQSLRHDDISSFARDHGASSLRLFRRIGVSFRLLQSAIVRARLRRLDGEWLYRRDYSEMMPQDEDATKFPQRPLILGDKWDF
jgi:hypothetical protein